MKTLSATSAPATAPPRPAAQSSGRLPSRTSADFALSGPSSLPDPLHHAYRKDLADIALAGRVIASHYAEPLPRKLAAASALRSSTADEAEAIAQLNVGDPFELLDDSLGWAWGYGGADRLVGYVRSECLA